MHLLTWQDLFKAMDNDRLKKKKAFGRRVSERSGRRERAHESK